MTGKSEHTRKSHLSLLDNPPALPLSPTSWGVLRGP